MIVLRISLPILFLHGLHDVPVVRPPPSQFIAHIADFMTIRLLNYSPPAVLIRLLATNGLIAYLTSSVLWLSGASSDPRLLLPAWISITTVRFPPSQTILIHTCN